MAVTEASQRLMERLFWGRVNTTRRGRVLGWEKQGL